MSWKGDERPLYSCQDASEVCGVCGVCRFAGFGRLAWGVVNRRVKASVEIVVDPGARMGMLSGFSDIGMPHET